MVKTILKHFLIRPVRTWRWPIYEDRFVRFLNSHELADFPAPRHFLKGASDQYLLWLFSSSSTLGYDLNGLIPAMPTDDVQRNWTGRIGESTLREAFHFFRILRRMADKCSKDIGENTQVLDYGCGWGRVIRFFLRDVDHTNLYGCDCYPEAIEMAKHLNKWCNFEFTRPFPPTDFESNKFDLIYLYSVFSHLSEDLHLKLLREFHRILSSDGMLVATTRARDFILHCERIRKQTNVPHQLRGSSESFAEVEPFLKKYDQGLFCHSPTGGGGTLESSFYGESCIPRKYVEDTWTRWFDIVEYRYADEKCGQNVICCRKK